MTYEVHAEIRSLKTQIRDVEFVIQRDVKFRCFDKLAGYGRRLEQLEKELAAAEAHRKDLVAEMVADESAAEFIF